MIKTLTFGLAFLCAVCLASTLHADELVQDGSFEGGSPNGFWSESSTNFGSPLCTIDLCGTGTGTGPNSGLWWAWFGGVGAFEQGIVSQPITFPDGTATLSFAFENIVSDSSQDFIEARLDGAAVWTYNGGGPLSGNLGYTDISVNIDSFADGGTHTLEFFSEIFGQNGGGSNFFLDDVSIDANVIPEPATGCVALLGLFGLVSLRRKS